MVKKVIAIDFDGTIVDDKFPDFGDVKEGAKEVINELLEVGHEVIIWSCQDAEEIEHVLYRLGINYTAINENTESMMQRWGNNPRKIGADNFIDDKGLDTTNIDWEWINFQLIARGIL